MVDPDLPLDTLVRDSLALIEDAGREEGAVALPQPTLPLPGALYGQRLLATEWWLQGDAAAAAEGRSVGVQAHDLKRSPCGSTGPRQVVDMAPGAPTA